jgi:hypothetical protein
MHRRSAIAGVLSLPLLARAVAPPELGALRPQGRGQMRWFGLLIYDIRLWARETVDAQNWASQSLALELEYARSLSGREIAKRSLVEMRRQAGIAETKALAWLAEMEAAFPDVQAGDRISGLHEPGLAVQFFVNGRPQRRIADAEFSRLFFGIWLAPQSSEPALRRQLLEGALGR